MRLRTMTLPDGGFVLVIDDVAPGHVEQLSKATGMAEQVGARALLVFSDRVELGDGDGAA